MANSYEQMSDEQLFALAGISPGAGIPTPSPLPTPAPVASSPYENMSDEQLFQLAGIQPPIKNKIEGTNAQRFGRAVVGGLTQLVPFMDEAVAAGSAGIDAIRGNGFNYDKRHQEIQDYQKQFNDRAGGWGTATQIGSGLLLPGLGYVDKAKGAVQTAKALAQEGAIYGGIYGASEGEGMDRFGNAAKGATVGAIATPIVGGALMGGAKTAGEVIGNAAERIRPATKAEEAIRSLGIGRSDVKNAAKYRAPTAPGEDAPIQVALDAATKAKVFDSGNTPDEWLLNINTVINALKKALTDILAPAEAKRTDLITPEWKISEKFIETNAKEEEALREQFNKTMNALVKRWDGSFRSLAEMKDILRTGGAFQGGATRAKGLDRAMYADVRTAIEKAASDVAPGLGDEVHAINEQLGRHYTVRDLLKKASDKGIVKELKPPKKSGILSGPSVITGGVLGSLASGNIAPAVVAGSAYAAQRAVNSPVSKALASATLSGTSKGLNALSGGANSIAPRITGASTPKSLQLFPSNTSTLGNNRSQDIGASNKPDSIAQALLKIQKGQQAPILASSEDPQTSSLSKIAKVLSNLGVQDAEASINTNIPKNMSKSTSELEPLLKAVKSVESAGNRLAVSNKGAKGAYQLMDATGREYHRRLGLKEKYDPFNESQAKVLAEAFLSDLKARYADDRIAIAAYNLGETRMNNAIKMRGLTAKTARWEDIYQLLPNETREYAPKVVSRIA